MTIYLACERQQNVSTQPCYRIGSKYKFQFLLTNKFPSYNFFSNEKKSVEHFKKSFNKIFFKVLFLFCIVILKKRKKNGVLSSFRNSEFSSLYQHMDGKHFRVRILSMRFISIKNTIWTDKTVHTLFAGSLQTFSGTKKYFFNCVCIETHASTLINPSDQRCFLYRILCQMIGSLPNHNISHCNILTIIYPFQHLKISFSSQNTNNNSILTPFLNFNLQTDIKIQTNKQTNKVCKWKWTNKIKMNEQNVLFCFSLKSFEVNLLFFDFLKCMKVWNWISNRPSMLPDVSLRRKSSAWLRVY